MPESIDYLISPPVDVEGEALVGGGSETWGILGIGDLGFMILGLGIPWGAVDDDGDPWPIEPGQHDPAFTARNRIWKQFENAATWISLANATGGAFGDAELVLEQLKPQRYVGTATGVWLEEIGATVGRARGGQTDDDDYRISIIAEALSQVTDGSPDEIIDLAQRIAPPPSDVILTEPHPATLVLTVTEIDAARFALLLEIMADMPSSGVGTWLDTYSIDDTGGPGWLVATPDMGAPGWDPQPDDVLATHAWGATLG